MEDLTICKSYMRITSYGVTEEDWANFLKLANIYPIDQFASNDCNNTTAFCNLNAGGYPILQTANNAIIDNAKHMISMYYYNAMPVNQIIAISKAIPNATFCIEHIGQDVMEAYLITNGMMRSSETYTKCVIPSTNQPAYISATYMASYGPEEWAHNFENKINESGQFPVRFSYYTDPVSFTQ